METIYVGKEVEADIVFHVKPATREKVLTHITELNGLADKLTDFEPESDIVGWILSESLFDIRSTVEKDKETIYNCFYHGVWTSRQAETLAYIITHGAKAKSIITVIKG